MANCRYGSSPDHVDVGGACSGNRISNSGTGSGTGVARAAAQKLSEWRSKELLLGWRRTVMRCRSRELMKQQQRVRILYVPLPFSWFSIIRGVNCLIDFYLAVRQAMKARILKEQEQQSKRIRWAVLAVLLALAVVCFYYYWYFQATDLDPEQRTRQNTPRTQREKPKGDRQKQKSKKTQKKSTEQKEGAGGKSKGKGKAGKSKAREAAAKAERDRMEKMNQRVLRQPIPGSDPDRPHTLEIISADNILMEGDYKEALDRFNAILSQFPQSPRALLGKGLTLARMAKEKKSNKLMDTAIDFFRKAGVESFLATETVKLSALLAMVDHARDRGNLKLAIEGTEKLVELYKDNALYANQLGMLYLTQGSRKQARTQFRKNVERFEENAFAKAQLGYFLYSEKQYEQALPLLLEGIRQDKEVRVNANFYNYAGDVLVRLNRSEEVCFRTYKSSHVPTFCCVCSGFCTVQRSGGTGSVSLHLAALDTQRAGPESFPMVVTTRHWVHDRHHQDREGHGQHNQVHLLVGELGHQM
jgi:tetratricopeptide (TPR) repeat protein